MKKIFLTMLFITLTCAAVNAGLITIPDKSTGQTLSAVEFNEILDALKDGTKDINTLSMFMEGIFDMGSIDSIADGDATPDISAGSLFVTGNTGPTTITAFDAGAGALTTGHFFAVSFGDANTTIDFTGTTLKGHGLVDWTPDQYDMMVCKYDGANFICMISSQSSIDADKITDGSTNAAITLTQETNFETAYSHSQDNTQAHSDYVLNTGADTLGAGSGFALTFDAGATDPIATFGSDSVAWTGAATFTVGGSQVLTSESDPNALLTAGTDNVKDTHIDWGAGAGQVDADDISDGSTNAIITLTQETNFGTAYSHSQDNTQAHSDYVLNTGADTLGSGSGFALTFDAGATDPVFTFGSDSVAITGATTFTVNGSQVQTGADVILKDLVTTLPLSGGQNDILPGADADVTLSIADADDDGSTKGAATFDNTDFNAVAGLVTIVDDGHSHTGTSISELANADISAAADIVVTKLADSGTAYDIIQTDSAGTAVEWTDTLTTAYISDAIPIVDNGDTTKELFFELSGIGTGTSKTVTVDTDDFDFGSMDITTTGDVATGSLVATGTINGGVSVTPSDTATVAVSGMHGYYLNNDNDAIEFDLPAAVVNMRFCFRNLYAQAITIDPDASDTIMLGATTASAGEAIVSTGAATEYICLVGTSASTWVSMESIGTWAEESP